MGREPVSFKPLDVTDLIRMEQITLQSGIDAKHSSKNANGHISLTDEVRSSIIKLSIPVVNEVLAGSDGKYIAMFLGMKKEYVKNLIQCNAALVWDEVEQKYVYDDSIESTDSCTDYIMGPRALIYLIENFDSFQAINDIAVKIVQSMFSKQKSSAMSIGSIDRIPGDNPILLFSNYYYNIHDMASFNTYAHSDWQVRLSRTLKDELGGTFKRLALLLNTPIDYTQPVGTKTNLDVNSRVMGRYPRIANMFMSYVTVLPTALHMSIGMNNSVRKDPLTTLYEEVLDANMNFESILALPSLNVQTYKAAYDRLQDAVNSLLGTNKNKASIYKKSNVDRSILNRMIGKNGQIRKYNLGKRQDYSGRAVVTIDPFLSVDRITIPEDMIPKIYQYHLLPHLQKRIEDAPADSPLKGKSLTNLSDPVLKKEMIKIAEEINLLDNVPLYLGRQPTLHKLSMQGFYIDKSNSTAIQVSPLVCPAFNMDFDGDAAHLEVPLSEGAIQEVKDLMITTKNIFLSKNGESTIEPRQDILLGLYMCTRNTNYSNAKSVNRTDFKSIDDIKEKVMMNQYKVWDKVNVNGQTVTAGDAAFMACFRDGDIVGRKSIDNTVVRERNAQHAYVTEVTDKNIGDYVEFILRKSGGKFVYPMGSSTYDGDSSKNTFVGCINRLVELGFKVARLYPPTISLIDAVNKGSSEYETCIDNLYEETRKSDFAYALGLETSDMHKSVFTSALSKVTKTINSGISSTLDDNDGYKLMAMSGARGKTSNLYQIFKYKGQIQKDDNTSFDAIVENCYRSQLTPFEHFICAYGGRQGQMDKSLKTGDIGYASRQMWHTTQGYVITEEDCGTSMGIPVDRDFIANMYNPEDIDDFMIRMLEGHYEVYPDGSSSNTPISHEEAANMVTSSSATTHWIRTPYTCNNPCCQKCYGIDWSTHEVAIVGTNVGIIAAQSIGEPATQLTMKQFQKGGVAGASDVSSAFERVNSYLLRQDLHKTSNGYDPVAWESGVIEVLPNKDVSLVNLHIKGTDKQLAVNRNIVLRTNSNNQSIAIKGYGMSIRPGDMDLMELTEAGGIEWAQRYFVGKLFDIYSDQSKIKMIHFEILAAALTRYKILSTNRSDLRVGLYCTAQELHAGNPTIVTPVEGGYKVVSSPFYKVTPNNPDIVITLKGVLSQPSYVICYPSFVSVKSVIQCSNDALDNIDMENIKDGLARINAFDLKDSFTKPINRMLLAKPIINGSNVPGFMETRAQQI